MKPKWNLTNIYYQVYKKNRFFYCYVAFYVILKYLFIILKIPKNNKKKRDKFNKYFIIK